jgi:hypothetical protein
MSAVATMTLRVTLIGDDVLGDDAGMASHQPR